MIISKNCQNCIEIKFEIENVDFVRQKLWVENFESKILSDFKLNKMSNRVDGCKSWVTAIKKLGYCINGWMNE